MNRSFGRYRVLQSLGQGAMAAVFLARDPVLARLVAIKVLHPDLAFKKPLLERFFKEAKIAARIQNPHIVEVFDFGQEGGSPYLVMEFIDGQPLQKVMDQMKGEPLDQVVAAALVCQAAEGLTHAAEAGVVHRDLKPDNLMLSARGNLKVTDFGICHLAEHTMTLTGQTLGSPRFMSPEQVKGLKPITVQSDLFSLGAVLYYFLSGQTPFMAQSLPDLYRQITEMDPPSLESIRGGLDPFLIKLVNALLDKNPARRGGGPGWLQYQLKMYLVQRKIVDPVSLISQYVREISTQGVQTTCNLDAATIKRHMGSFDLEHKPRTSRNAWLIASFTIALLVVAGIGWVSLKGRIQNSTLSDPPIVRTFAEEKGLEPMTAIQKPPQSKKQASTNGVQIPDRFIQDGGPTNRPLMEEKEPIPADSIGISILTIYSAPPFAEVSINGVEFGRTPIEGKPIQSGRYNVKLKSRLGKSVDTSITLAPGSNVHKFTLLSNPETPSEK